MFCSKLTEICARIIHFIAVAVAISYCRGLRGVALNLSEQHAIIVSHEDMLINAVSDGQDTVTIGACRLIGSSCFEY